MNVVLFRHAQKGLTPFDNPHLSPDGFAQAEAIAVAVANRSIPAASEIWISEKIRTHQTMQFVARDLKLSTLEKAELDLRGEQETQAQFQSRVHKVIQQIDLSSRYDSLIKTIYMCTHYDWIEEAMTLIPCDTDLSTFQFAHWGPAQFAQFEIESGLWKFIKKGAYK